MNGNNSPHPKMKLRRSLVCIEKNFSEWASSGAGGEELSALVVALSILDNGTTILRMQSILVVILVGIFGEYSVKT